MSDSGNDQRAETERTEQVCSGLRIAVWAILLNLVSVVLLVVPDGAMIRAVTVLLAIVLAVWGTVRMARGMKFDLIVIVLLAMVMVLPMLNLVILLIVNARAARFLREHGYRVGLLGAMKEG